MMPEGLSTHRLIQPPSEVRKLPMNGLVLTPPERGMALGLYSPVSITWASSAPCAHHAEDSSETSISTASPVFLRWNSAAEMPPAMNMPPIESPNAGMPWPSGPSSSAGRHGVGDAAARPEAGAVEAADQPLGPLVAQRRAARVDDVGIDRADVLDVELVLLAVLGEVVGQEHVGGLGQFVEHFLAFGRGEVDADAALAAVGVFDQRVAQRIELDPAHVEEAALGIAAHRMLDLDHVRAPVGEDRARRRRERELRHFEDAHALHYLGRHRPDLLSGFLPIGFCRAGSRACS